jgi:hypothetical protein
MNPEAAGAPADPADALRFLAEMLRGERSELSAHVIEPAGEPALGLLAAAGPRASASPGDYSALVEAIREGYLLHYGTPRLLAPADPNQALLAGDYLYALGLERLANLADTEAVAELSDLISLSAQAHAAADGPAPYAPPLWLASVAAVAAGAGPGHAEAKAAARAGAPEAPEMLWQSARDAAAAGELQAELERAAENVGFALPQG